MNMEQVKTWLFKKLSGDLTGTIILTTAISWAASCGGQLVGISNNKELDKDKKKFMLFQELADGVINVVSYLIITRNVTKLAKSLVTSGKITTKHVTEMMEKCNIKPEMCDNLGKLVANNLTKAKNCDAFIKESISRYNPSKMAKVKSDLANAQDLKKSFNQLETGVGMVGTIAGGVLSTNILTPIFRNKIASDQSKDKKAEFPVVFNQVKPMRSGSMKV